MHTSAVKQTIAYTATILWANIPTQVNFPKQLKFYLLSDEHNSENLKFSHSILLFCTQLFLEFCILLNIYIVCIYEHIDR